MSIRTYSELITFPTFEERYEYLAFSAKVGESTFGWERYLNQGFYNSSQWRQVRNLVIVRDNGCDLGIEGRELYSSIYIHHMNPMTAHDLRVANPRNLDPEYLISVSHRTHNAIHYGDVNQLQKDLIERTPGDTKPW